jgi:hypothetical protein
MMRAMPSQPDTSEELRMENIQNSIERTVKQLRYHLLIGTMLQIVYAWSQGPESLNLSVEQYNLETHFGRVKFATMKLSQPGELQALHIFFRCFAARLDLGAIFSNSAAEHHHHADFCNCPSTQSNGKDCKDCNCKEWERKARVRGCFIAKFQIVFSIVFGHLMNRLKLNGGPSADGFGLEFYEAMDADLDYVRLHPHMRHCDIPVSEWPLRVANRAASEESDLLIGVSMEYYRP